MRISPNPCLNQVAVPGGSPAQKRADKSSAPYPDAPAGSRLPSGVRAALVGLTCLGAVAMLTGCDAIAGALLKGSITSQDIAPLFK